MNVAPAPSCIPDPRATIRTRALQLGFDAVGFCTANLASQAKERLTKFLQSGYHGEMDWLARRTDERSHPQALWPEANSVVVLGLSYAPDYDPLENLQRPAIGAISAYAGNRDYHDVLKGRLKHLAQFMASRLHCQVKVFVDTAPVMEKPLAQQAALGWQGKHTNLVSRRHGSWLLLGEIYTDMKLSPNQPESDHCGSCANCLDICPTRAFTGPYRLDATRCISYLTIEHKGPIPVPLRSAMGNRIYGCDDCLAVCPWNKFATPTQESALQRRAAFAAPRLAELAALDDAGFRSLFSASPVKRIGRDRFVRNVMIAIGNSADSALLPVAARMRNDANPVVAEAAAWAHSRLALSATSPPAVEAPAHTPVSVAIPSPR